MNMKLKLILIYLFLFQTTPAIAQIIALHCSGKTEGSDIQTSYDSIDIKIHMQSGEMHGFPNYKAPGCSSFFKNFKLESNTTESQFLTECSNSNSSSTLRLNRYSGSLTIITFFNKDNAHWTSQYMCNEQKKRKF